jgi:flagellar basal-body rod protein FlgB
MGNELFNDPTMQGMEYALNSLSLRQQVIANNIANIQTPGYISQDVSFEQQLSGILGGQTTTSPLDTGTVTESPDLSASPDGNTVSMESEMSKMNETNILYDALTQLTADRMGILKTAITG